MGFKQAHVRLMTMDLKMIFPSNILLLSFICEEIIYLGSTKVGILLLVYRDRRAGV